MGDSARTHCEDGMTLTGATDSYAGNEFTRVGGIPPALAR
jgi:hypothetical protein